MGKFCLIVAGTRTFDDYDLLKEKIDRALLNHQNDEIIIVQGEAKGADTLAKRYAKEKGYECVSFPAQWDKHGKAAGFIRNRQMHEYAAQFEKRGCIIFWDGESRGTAQNIELAKEFGTQLVCVKYKELKKEKTIFDAPVKRDGTEAVCVTTNGKVRVDGRVVMGAGIAKAFRD